MKKTIKFFTILLLICTAFYFGLYGYAKILKKIDLKKENTYYIYDNNEDLVNQNDDWVKLDDISEDLINATISIEDKNFYKHIGFDYLRILKALTINIKNGSNVQGASTISQQYSKNLFLNFDKTWERKINEAWITIQIESHYTKDEILEGYLNTINYGGVFGIENASYYYFNKSSSELNLAEASMLAGIPKSPSNYSPLTNLENAKNRQKIILNAMVNNGYITEEEKEEAYNTNLEYYGKTKSTKSSTLMYYQDAVISELKSLEGIPSSLIETGGLKVYTNLDLEAQLNLEENINTYLSEDEDLQIASIMMDPNTGAIKALVGGRDYSKSQYNRATTASRQVGSTLKPFLYYSALENGFTASTTFNSSETTFVFSNDEKYSPKNYAEIYGNKDISMAAALAYSDNIYAVKTHLFLGEDNLINILNRIGINSNLSAIPSLALGTSSISMVDMVKAYSTLANSGYKVTPHLINKVTTSDGTILYEFKQEKEVILNSSITYIVNELLNNCYNSNFIDYNYPTCMNIAGKLTKKYAIKTGTTDTDNLVFGYNSEMVLGIWAGYDDNKDTYSKVSSNIKNIFADTMESYFKDKEDTWYKTPENVVGVMVDPISGNIATEDSKKAILYYIKGTEPNSSDITLDTLIPTIKEED